MEDSVRFHHDIIFCMFCVKSDHIVVSFSYGAGKLRVDVRQFWFQYITCDFLSSCILGVLLFLSTTYEREIHSLRKSTKRTNTVYPRKILSIVVYEDSER